MSALKSASIIDVHPLFSEAYKLEIRKFSRYFDRNLGFMREEDYLVVRGGMIKRSVTITNQKLIERIRIIRFELNINSTLI